MTRLRRFLPVIALLIPSLSYALDCRYEVAPDAEYGRNYANYARWCEECGGTPYKENGIGCNPGPEWGHPAGSSAPTNQSDDSSADNAARDAKVSQDRKEAEEERNRFINERDNALHSLKGVSPTSSGGLKLKGATDSFSTQLKSTGPKIEGTTLKTAPTRKAAAPTGVWKQILCADGLAAAALEAARIGDVENAGFLLDESAKAANGRTLSVECPEATLPKGFNNAPPEGKDLSAFYLKLKTKAVRDANAIAEANAAKPDLQKKLKEAHAAAAAPVKTGATDIDRAREEQRRINEARSKDADGLKKKQLELNKANDEELAFLREAQKLLNDQNSKKAKAQESVKEMRSVATSALRDPRAATAALDQLQ